MLGCGCVSGWAALPLGYQGSGEGGRRPCPPPPRAAQAGRAGIYMALTKFTEVGALGVRSRFL